jgi:thiamine-monophosphate kinase
MSDPRPPTPSISSVGESGLVERIAGIVGTSSAVVGIGDDAAVIDRPGDSYLLATVDALVENVHFRTNFTSAAQLGRRAIEINASDIAAMGGTPEHALVSLALPPRLEISFVDELYEGLSAAARSRDIQIVGGNLARTGGPITVDVTLLGSVPKFDLVTRRGARSGDVLAVTGTLGDAAASRLAVDAGLHPDEPELQTWMDDHAVPRARVREGQALARSHLAHAMIDLSDGLSSDLSHLCGASGVGAVIEDSRLPISRGVRWAARKLRLGTTELALSGGEDYELLVAIAEADLAMARELGVSLTPVGRAVSAADGVTLRSRDGSSREPSARGWAHF